MKISAGMQGIQGITARMEKHVAFATSLGINYIAEDVKDATERGIERVFDTPIAYTKRGVFRTRATKHRPYSRVGIKDRQAEYLGIQETGGTRRPKRKALLSPVEVRTNRHGNIPRGGIRRLLAREDTFSGVSENGTPGIWRRMPNGKVRLMVFYSKRQQYRKRFGFKARAAKVVRTRSAMQMRRALAYAIKTVR